MIEALAREADDLLDLMLGNSKFENMKTMTLSAVLNPEEDGYVSLCPELDIASQGDTIEAALANLKEALEGFLETADAEEVQARLKKPALFTRIEVECA
jgi:predicted RNase H-like HicB family nuclease